MADMFLHRTESKCIKLAQEEIKGKNQIQIFHFSRPQSNGLCRSCFKRLFLCIYLVTINNSSNMHSLFIFTDVK